MSISIIGKEEFEKIAGDYEFIEEISSSYESRGAGLGSPGRPAEPEEIDELTRNVIRWAEETEGAEILVLEEPKATSGFASCSEYVDVVGNVYRRKSK